MNFNEDQQIIADKILAGQSVNVQAPAGSGKSYILKNTLNKLKGVAVVCPTGAAAVQLGMGATTIHKLFGFKPTIQTPNQWFNKVPEKYAKVLKRIKVLVVDEYGAVRRDLLEAMDHRLRMVHGVDKPWGGVQVILTGDLSQSAPILTNKEAPHYHMFYSSKWCFTSDSIKHIPTYTLKKIERNSDARQQKIMNSVRNKDKWAELAIQRIIEMSEPYRVEDGKTVLCQYNADADKINNLRASEVSGKVCTYIADETGKPSDLKDIPVPEVVELKVGYKVMLVANDLGGAYVNGDTGVVIGCQEDCVVVTLDRTGSEVLVTPFEWDVIRYKARGTGLSKTVVATRSQLPIKLGWAVSIHKSQGMTLPSAAIHMGNNSWQTAMEGVFYVAISRVTDLRKLSFLRMPRLSDIQIDQEVVKYIKGLEA